jgi:ribosomal protein S18 acetylase RimI-like enzyme
MLRFYKKNATIARANRYCYTISMETIKKKDPTKSIIYAIALITGVALAVACAIYFITSESGPIYSFNYQRDHKDVTTLLTADSYWLFEDPNSFDIEHMLKTKSPDKKPRYHGKLHIKVLRENKRLAGFVTYHPTSSTRGRVQFLSVHNDFRGKGYGKLLLNYAVKDLFNKGCNTVTLVTRTKNIWAQRIYKELGFKEYRRDEGFVDFVIRK